MQTVVVAVSSRNQSSPAKRLSSLSPGGRALALIYALFAPRALALARLRALLEDPDLKSLNAPGSAALDAELAALERAGVAERRDSGDVAIGADSALSLLRRAREEGALPPILSAVERLKQREQEGPRDGANARSAHDRDHATAVVLMRGYLWAGDVGRFEEVRERDRLSAWDLAVLAEPFAEEVIAALPPADLRDACGACLGQVLVSAAPADQVIDFCAKVSQTPLEHAADIAYIRLLQGRFDEAEAPFDALPSNVEQRPEAQVGRAATRALAAMLRGEDELALRHIEAALDILKGGHKRLQYPDLPAFGLALLALARIESPQTLDLLTRIAAARRYDQREDDGLRLAQTAVRIKAKRGLPFAGVYVPTGLAALFAGVQRAWQGGLGDDGEELLGSLRTLHHRALANGFRWVAAECGEVLQRLAETDINAPEDAPSHAELGTVTLTTLTVPAGSWEQSLAALEEVASDGGAPEADEPEAPSERLLWTLHVSGAEVSLATRAQRRGANGAWSRGKQYGAKRLAAESTKMKFLLPQDVEAIAAADERSTYGKSERFFGLRSLFALAGHPHVYCEDQTVEVVRRAPELSVRDDADGVLVRIDPYRAGTDGAYAARMVAPGRCEITHFTAEHQRLFRAVPEAGLRVPARAKARLLNTIPSLAASVRVASSVQSPEADAVQNATQVAADAEPWVRLEPLEAGLSIALEVEPIPRSGVCFAPGAGGAVVFAHLNGENVQAERDLDAERQAFSRLAAECPPLAAGPTPLQPLALPEPDECLELLELLDAAGARCKWPHGETMRVVSRASAGSLRMTMKSAAQWMSASAQLPLDGERVLDFKRLFALLEDKPDSRFLALGNGEFLALTQTFRRQLDDLASLASVGAKGELRLHPLAALAAEELIDNAQLDADDGWKALRERTRAASAVEPVVPSTLQAELRPYQLDGYRWLSRLAQQGVGACLADDMGLGKTIQTLAMLLDRAPAGAALVVAPTSVVPNWLAEARRFAPTLNAKAYTGAAAARAALLKGAGPFDLVVATYGLLQNDADALAAAAWHTVVLDEAQAIKNPAAKRSRAAKSLKADFRLMTTGTPVQNNLLDLHSLFGFANPGLLGSLQRFRAHFALPIERDRNAVAQARLRRLIGPFVLRRLKADVLDDLPQRTEITLHVKMSEEEASLYEALRLRALEDLTDDAGGHMRLFAHLTRLRLACCNPKLVLDADDAPADLPLATASAKLETFASTLADLLENRHKVLVFSQFVMHLRLVENHLRETGVQYQYLDGATSPKERAARIAAFQAGEGDVFLISLTAGGVGLNLTAADYVIHMDPWWNPAVEDQASDRAHRIGQTRPVTIYRLVAEGTIEEQIVALHHRKRDLAEKLLEGTDAPSRLDAEEMMELLRQPFSG